MKMELEGLIMSNCVKYNLLNPMIQEAFSGSSAEEINIYIDIYSVTKILYSSITDGIGTKNITHNNYNSLCACLVNMAAHYRHFFRTRYRVESNIFFVNSKNNHHYNNVFIKGYNSTYTAGVFKKDIMTEFVTNNLNLLGILAPYLPNIYLVNSDFETGVVIYDLMCRTDLDNSKGHFIITKDPYNYQLVPMKPQTVILRTKPKDQSYIIHKNNLLDKFFEDRKVKTRNTVINPQMLSLLMTLTSVKERNIKTSLNISTAVKVLEKAISENRILNGYSVDLMNIFNNIATQDFPMNFTEFEFRFKAIDIQFQHSLFMSDPESIIMNDKLIDKYDPETIKQLNNEYFRVNPLDLNAL